MKADKGRLTARRRTLLVGAAVAALAAAALYLIPAPSSGELIALARGEPRVGRGFIGVANFGGWRLICMTGPPSLEGLATAGDSVQDHSWAPKSVGRNACRINHEMTAPEQKGATGPAPAPVIVAVNFSLVGAKRTPAAMLRLPGSAQAGDVITLRFDNASLLNTMVRACSVTECIAAATLTPADWQRLSAARSLQLTFPAVGRQWAIVDLPTQGLASAMAALERAPISSVH